jgi:voltage-gated potassium channel
LNIERRGTKLVLERFDRAFESGRILRWLVLTIAVITVAYGALMRLVDPHDFPTFGTAIWWAASTVTTIGYGDVVPTTAVGRSVAAGLMIFGFASLSLLTGIVASVFVHRRTSAEQSGLSAIEDRLTEIERLLRVKS